MSIPKEVQHLNEHLDARHVQCGTSHYLFQRIQGQHILYGSVASSVPTIQENLYHDIRSFLTFYHGNITIIVRNGTLITFNPSIP